MTSYLCSGRHPSYRRHYVKVKRHVRRKLARMIHGEGDSAVICPKCGALVYLTSHYPRIL